VVLQGPMRRVPRRRGQGRAGALARRGRHRLLPGRTGSARPGASGLLAVQRTNGGWVISFTVQRSPKARRARRRVAVVGVDVGLARLATLSTGDQYANGRPLEAALRSLRRLQRQLDRQRRANNPGNYHPDGRTKKGCKNWVKSQSMGRTEQRIAQLHERVANLRREQAHQLTSALTREFGVIGVETLAVKNLMANRRLARHIADVGWGTVLGQLNYKTSWSARACAGPRRKCGPQPRPHGAPARADRGHCVVRGPHRTVHANCARRAGQPGRSRPAQPREARSVLGHIPAR
jgi:hypothetical protein